MGQVSRYSKIFENERGHVDRQTLKEELTAHAIIEYLMCLGRSGFAKPNLVKGNIRIGLVEYFSQPYFDNALNRAALSIVPNFTWKPGYGGSDLIVGDKPLKKALSSLGIDEIEALKQDTLEARLVVQRIGFGSAGGMEVARWKTDNSSRPTTLTSEIGVDLTRDLVEGIVAPVDQIAQRVQSLGEASMFDHLSNVFELVSERAERVAFAGPNGTS